MNSLDTLHGDRVRASAGADSPAEIDIGFVTGVNARNVTASVFLPQKNMNLKDVPVSFSFMSSTSGNIALPEIDSAVVVIRSKFIRPFIFCSAGKLVADGVRSDIVRGEQLLANTSRAFMKQGLEGEQILFSGALGTIYQQYDGTKSGLSKSSYENTMFGEDIQTDIEGQGIKYQTIISKQFGKVLYEDDDFIDASTSSVEASLESDVIFECQGMINALGKLSDDVVAISDIICTEDIENKDTFQKFLDKESHLFDFLTVTDDPVKVIIQTGAAIDVPVGSKKELSSKARNSLENIDGARTIYKIGTESDGHISEKFAVTTGGARIREGNIRDRMSV